MRQFESNKSGCKRKKCFLNFQKGFLILTLVCAKGCYKYFFLFYHLTILVIQAEIDTKKKHSNRWVKVDTTEAEEWTNKNLIQLLLFSHFHKNKLTSAFPSILAIEYSCIEVIALGLH